MRLSMTGAMEIALPVGYLSSERSKADDGIRTHDLLHGKQTL
jgi:hypothetical protein